jgi:hypothetical protein
VVRENPGSAYDRKPVVCVDGIGVRHVHVAGPPDILDGVEITAGDVTWIIGQSS